MAKRSVYHFVENNLTFVLYFTTIKQMLERQRMQGPREVRFILSMSAKIICFYFFVFHIHIHRAGIRKCAAPS